MTLTNKTSDKAYWDMDADKEEIIEMLSTTTAEALAKDSARNSKQKDKIAVLLVSIFADLLDNHILKIITFSIVFLSVLRIPDGFPYALTLYSNLAVIIVAGPIPKSSYVNYI
jgi:hypothetical protein